MKAVFFCAFLCLALSGCQATLDWFNSIGDHLPVIGQRCENWQCFTSSGQQSSEQRKAQTPQTPQENPQSAPATSAIVPLTPPPTQASPLE